MPSLLTKPKKVLIETYGCTLNQADSDIMKQLLENNGYSVDEKEEGAAYDFVILNTCTVKKVTEQKILHRIGKLKMMGSNLIVCGCMASANKEIITNASPKASIISTSNVNRIAETIASIESGASAQENAYQRLDKSSLIPVLNSIIARIPISEGCLSNCSFCETKFARGPLNSFSQDVLLNAIKMNINAGAKEIELTSQDTGAYGIDKGTNIAELVSKASDIEGKFRIRIGMLNPQHLRKYFDDLLEAYKSEHVYKFIHIPVQSGSDSVLKDMERLYTVDEFVWYCKELEKKIPGINIATDIIVGFPTETEDDFNATMDLLKEVEPNITNVSKFAKRPHAKASSLRQLSNEVVKKRSVEASRLSRQLQTEKRKALIGTKREVLVNEKGAKSFMGRDEYYYEVAFIDTAPFGEFVDAEVVGVSPGSLLARQCE